MSLSDDIVMLDLAKRIIALAEKYETWEEFNKNLEQFGGDVGDELLSYGVELDG